MQTFQSVCGNRSHQGGIVSCLEWAAAAVATKPNAVVKVFRIRAGDRQGRIIAEVDRDGIHDVNSGRLAPTKALRRAVTE